MSWTAIGCGSVCRLRSKPAVMSWTAMVAVLLVFVAVLLPTASSTHQLNDAAEYEDPKAKAVMECSDLITPVIGEETGRWIYVGLARSCSDDAALAVVQGRTLFRAFAAANKCFTRTLFPRVAKDSVDRLVTCIRDVLTT